MSRPTSCTGLGVPHEYITQGSMHVLHLPNLRLGAPLSGDSLPCSHLSCSLVRRESALCYLSCSSPHTLPSPSPWASPRVPPGPHHSGQGHHPKPWLSHPQFPRLLSPAVMPTMSTTKTCRPLPGTTTHVLMAGPKVSRAPS